MLSEQQLNYAKSIINTYQKQGYKYYLCISNSDRNINVDFYIYFSKDEIKAIDQTSFTIKNGICISVRTNYRYNERPDVLSLQTSIPGNLFVVYKYEYVYTNAIYSDSISNVIYYPDLLLSGTDSYNNLHFTNLTIFMVIAIFLYMFIKSILRIRR